MTTADLPVPAVGDRYISTTADDTGRVVTITRVWEADDRDGSGTHTAVAFEWGERGQCGSACPIRVFHRHYRPEADPDAALSPTLRHLRDAFLTMPTGDRPATPEQVSAILRDDNSPLYPSAIVVYCDECGIEVERDYIVSTEQTSAERLEIARGHLRADGWRCNDNGDFCPTCQEPPAPHGPGAARQVAEALAADGAHSHLSADGETVCLSGHCAHALLTPGEVLL